jgi:hypothetical protein
MNGPTAELETKVGLPDDMGVADVLYATTG